MINQRRCPACDACYPAGHDFCSRDGAPLVDDAPEALPPDPREGEVIADRFRLVRRLGEGGMGAVYLATHQVLGRRYAVKLMHREFIADRRACARFFREARAASVVDHPNVISIYDYGQTRNGEPYLVMEYAEGVSLFDAAKALLDHRMPPGRTVDIAIQIARALQHAHERGVIHRDIKPENVLLTQRDGLPDWVRLLDFGVARISGLPPMTQAGELVGTVHFMAPELLSGDAPVSPAVDLYALGILLHDLLVGSPPFDGEMAAIIHQHVHLPAPNLSRRKPDLSIPIDLDRLVADLLEKDPARRPDAAETAMKLEQVRALLPPRSLGSLLIAQTMILSVGRPLAVQPTILLPGRSNVETRVQPDVATVILPALLQEVDQLEQEVERTASSLAERVEALGRKVWPGRWPAEAASLRQQLVQCEKDEETVGMQMALLRDRIEGHRQDMQRHRENVRRQIIDLSERLQLDPDLGENDRRRLGDDLAKRERDFADTEEQLLVVIPAKELEQVQRRMHDLRGELEGTLMELTRKVLDTACPPSLRAERDRVADLLGQLETTTALLTAHLQRVRPSNLG